SEYSRKAIPQLTRIATIRGLFSRFFKWPYQAKVMKMLEPNRSRMVFMVRFHLSRPAIVGGIYLIPRATYEISDNTPERRRQMGSAVDCGPAGGGGLGTAEAGEVSFTGSFDRRYPARDHGETDHQHWSCRGVFEADQGLQQCLCQRAGGHSGTRDDDPPCEADQCAVHTESASGGANEVGLRRPQSAEPDGPYRQRCEDARRARSGRGAGPLFPAERQ